MINSVPTPGCELDKNLSDTIAEALEDWLNNPEKQELIKKHNFGK